MKPVISFQDGKLHIKISVALDADVDGKPSAEADVKLALNPAEIISEIAKKDTTFLEALLKQIKV